MSNTKEAKPKRLLSLFLALVMVLGLLPVTAFAVENGDCVKVDGGVELGGFSQKFYYDCATKTVCDTVPESGSYAHFIRDYSGGSVNVLELCNYTGGTIQYDSSNKRDWQINLIGENTITVEADGAVQGILSCKALHIFGDRAGAKLTVNAKTTSTDKNKWAVGIFMMYESDLIIGGYADVTVNVEGETQVTGVGSVHSNYFGSSFGGGVTLQGNASLKIDCAVRFSQMFLSTACIYARSLKVNTKGDLTATIAPTNSEDTMGCYSVSVTYATLDYVRKMTVKGTMTKVQKSNHGSINGFDSSSDGKIRFDEDVLAYNCTSDNVAQWRGSSGEKPVTLTAASSRTTRCRSPAGPIMCPSLRELSSAAGTASPTTAKECPSTRAPIPPAITISATAREGTPPSGRTSMYIKVLSAIFTATTRELISPRSVTASVCTTIVS